MHSEEDLLYRSILIASIILGIIILAFVLFIIRQQRIFRVGNLGNIQTEIAALERDRQKIAEDLHDEAGALLSLLKLNIENLNLPDEEREKHRKCINLADTVIVRNRQISEGLMPLTLINFGLLYAVQEFVEAIHENTHTEIVFEHDGIPRLPAEYAKHIFRMIQEIIHNTLKHAHADTLKIKLLTDAGYFILLTADDGTGFTQHGMYPNKGLGLQTLKNRASLLKGNVHLSSIPGNGTRYHIRIPLPTLLL